MTIQADPHALRYAASRFSAGAVAFRGYANRLIGHKSNLVLYTWQGAASQTFGSQSEQQATHLRKAAEIFEMTASALNSLAVKFEYVLELRRQAEQYEMASWEYNGDTMDDLHHRQNYAHLAAQKRHDADWEANAADSRASAELNALLSMLPQITSFARGATSGGLDGLPPSKRSYYLRHQDLFQDVESVETSKKTDDDEHWYEKAWDWVQGLGREYVAISMKNGPTDDFWYNETESLDDGISGNGQASFSYRAVLVG